MPTDLQNHWQTLAVNQSPSRGTDYPFTGRPSDDVRYLLGDLWLSYSDDACALAPPFHIVELWNFDLDTAGRRDMLIFDALDQLVFDTRDAADFIATAWGEHLWTLTWIHDDRVLRCTARTHGPPWDPTRTWASTITPTSSTLDARTSEKLPRRLNSIAVGVQMMQGSIVLTEGYNIQMRADDPLTPDGGRRLTRVRVRAVPGDGIGRTAGCEDIEPVIRRINSVAPTSAGDFKIDTQGCYWLQRPGEITLVDGRQYALGGAAFVSKLTTTINAITPAYIAGTTTEEKQDVIDNLINNDELTALATLQINNDCGPCCTARSRC